MSNGNWNNCQGKAVTDIEIRNIYAKLRDLEEFVEHVRESQVKLQEENLALKFSADLNTTVNAEVAEALKNIKATLGTLSDTMITTKMLSNWWKVFIFTLGVLWMGYKEIYPEIKESLHEDTGKNSETLNKTHR